MKHLNSYKKVYDRLSNWWEFGEQDRPCIIASKLNSDIADTGDLQTYWENTDFIMKRVKMIVENTEYYGEALPFHYVDYGASAMAGALGAKMEYVDKETIWAYPIYNSIEQVLDLKLDENHPFYCRILELTKKSVETAKNHYFVAPFALGGLTDSLSSLYGCENFLIDMIGEPELMIKALKNLKNIWIDAFCTVQGIIKASGNPGGIGWAGVWAPGSTFPIQEDISYMFSTDMFKKYCLPNLIDIFSVVKYPMYHLDGIGAIKHLDCLLEIKELAAVQWVPGSGHWELNQWHDLIEKILSKGKSVQLFASNLSEIDSVVHKFGSRGLLFTINTSDEFQTDLIIDKYCKD